MNFDFLQNKNEFSSFLFSEKFINLLMIDGKKVKAYKIFSKMVELLQQKSIKQNENTSMYVTDILDQAIQNCMPSLEVRKVRVAGTTYLVPAIIPKKKQEALAIRWIIEAARKKKKQTKLTFAQCLSEEVFEAFLKQGYARSKRNELHRLAEANRAYIRYRWW